ncbi:extracellular solute-binding protein [Gracilibacillus salitolerans]|uniref:Extracellular solute-binding protein n=1 Tax=Gracilibacillus salitolerans TaxID=2663022 RepID=A0A5Q2TTJ4_9BACI|nr:sugar ABC transporter substrate-binding protein [Gracilibacillus salitolerans]QGH36108.1 extracellular solute-binding protein [Gracilibacillus salitolerans]
MKRNLLLLSMIALAFLLLIGCSSNEDAGETNEGESNDNSSENASENDADEQIEISFSWWGDTGRHEKYNEIVDLFEEEYPNIKVDRQFGGWEDYWDRLTTQVSGGNAPDVVSMHQFYVSDYARRGALHVMNDMVDSGELDLSDFPDAALNSGKVGEEIVMVAKGITMPGYVYNTAVFDDLGVDYPGYDWTWDDFVDKAYEIKEAMGEDGWAFEDGSGGQLQPRFRYFARQSGQDVFTDDGKLGFDEQVLTDWWTMWDNMRQDDVIPDASTSNEYEGLPLEANMFATKKVAILGLPANQMYLYEEQMGEGEINIVRHPHIEGGPNGEYIEGAYLSITEASPHKEAAAKFIEFFVSNEKSVKIFKTEQGPPAGTEASNLVMEDLTPPEQRAVEHIQNTVELSEPAPYAPEGINEVETLFADNAEAIAFGQKSVEQAVTDFMSEARSILGE